MTAHRLGAAVVGTLLATVLGGCACSRATVSSTTSTPVPAPAPPAKERVVPIRLIPIVQNLEQPLFVTGAGENTDRLYIVQKTGLIRTWSMGVTAEKPFLDLSERVSTGGEQGLLGLAFAPDYATSRTYYVNYTDAKGDTVVSRFRADEAGTGTDPKTEQVLLRIPQPYSNHNGGMLAFGTARDGTPYLYVGTGDGGSSGDPQGNAQSTTSLLGKILRLDVSGGRGKPRPMIVARGLRNPWRFSFDRVTGDLWIGDVGQGAWEEIDVVRRDDALGVNFGWNRFEATHPYPPDSKPGSTTGITMPVVEYPHSSGKSVTGGYVYRGRDVPELVGHYVYGDYSSGRIWGLESTARSPQSDLLLESGLAISSFGEDDYGELHVVDIEGGTVYRIAAP